MTTRFARANPCKICGGHPGLPRGKGVRCTGYLLPDGDACVCTRTAEGAVKVLPDVPDGPGYVHKLRERPRAPRPSGNGRTWPTLAEAVRALTPKGATPAGQWEYPGGALLWETAAVDRLAETLAQVRGGRK